MIWQRLKVAAINMGRRTIKQIKTRGSSWFSRKGSIEEKVVETRATRDGQGKKSQVPCLPIPSRNVR